MIQANLLLPVAGKTSASFAVLDLMRLPLGILTGVGFIGGGAILRRGDLVSGVTTAGTLWIMTVIGLSFGGGQLGLGCAATALAYFTLVALKRVDGMIWRQHQAKAVIGAASAASFSALEGTLRRQGYEVRLLGQNIAESRTRLEISWKCREMSCEPMRLLDLLKQNADVHSFEMVHDGSH
jgi:putative Mg2+ transporter-C (MgtC) family protein